MRFSYSLEEVCKPKPSKPFENTLEMVQLHVGFNYELKPVSNET
jgi:hypothetical protein